MLLLVALSATTGCQKLKELRELRDEYAAGAISPPAAAVDIGIDVPDAADVFTPRDIGTDAGDGDASADMGFPNDTGAPDIQVFEEPPTIFDVYPAFGPTAGGTLVTVSGSRFTFDIDVRLGGVTMTQVDVIDQYELLFLTEPMEPGTYDLKVTTSSGTALFERAFTAVDPLAVLSVAPSESPLVGGVPVDVTGTGFSASTRFLFDDREAIDVRVIDSGLAELVVPPSDVAGPVDVVAIGGGFARARDAFVYAPRPQLDALVPNLGSPAGGERVWIDGDGIDETCELVFGTARAAVSRHDTGRLSVASPGGPLGSVDVAVDCGERGASLQRGAFTFVEPTGLTELISAWPPTGFASGGARVGLSGTQLADVERVWFGDEEAILVSAEAWVVEVFSPASEPGTVDIRVQTPTGDHALEDGFTFIGEPIVNTVEPAIGPVEGGWPATLDGSGLLAVDAVWIDGRPVEISTQTDGQLVFTAPAAAAGDADIVLVVGGLHIDSGLDLSFDGEFRVNGFSPSSGSIHGGTLVFVEGRGFTDDCVVVMDGQPTATDRYGTALLAAVAPPHEEGRVSFAITGCSDWTSSREYLYVDPTRLPGGVNGGQLDGEINVSVVEAGTGAPIPEATVMVNIRESSPFVAFTDAQGQVSFQDESLRGPQTITAFAEGRSAESYQNVDARNVTLVLDQIPPPPCDPATDPDGCQPPPPEPTGAIIGFLTGLVKIGDPPPGAVVAARIETTRYSPGYGNPSAGVDSVLYDNGGFTISTRLGEMALIAQCGWFLADGTFEPRRIGVVRNIFIRAGDEPFRTAIDCNIPLSEQVTFKLTNAPLIVPESEDPEAPTFPSGYDIQTSWDFGAEGHLETLPVTRSSEALFTGGEFPPLTGPMAEVSVSYTARALDRVANYPQAIAYGRGFRSYDNVVTFPAMLPVPALVTPGPDDTEFDGYMEWTYPATARVPDFYYVSINAAGEDFPRYVVYVPGYARSLNLAEFPEFNERVGAVPRPGEAGPAMYVLIRAVDVDAFDYDDFDRYALRSNNWRAMSLQYAIVNFPVVEPEPEEGGEADGGE